MLSLLLGVGDEFESVSRSLVGVQVAFVSVLAASSPLVLLLYASGTTYRGALGANMVLWVFSSLVALQIARKQLAPQLRHEKKLRTLGAWGFVLWAFVAVQTGWSLRPFIGRPDAPPQFLRSDALSNAYVGLWNLVTARGTPKPRND